MQHSPPDGTHDVGRRWVEAINRRDAETLVELAAVDVAVYPTRLVGDRGPYRGHDGLRRWIADFAAAGGALIERVDEVRNGQPDELVLLGKVLVGDEPVSPFSMLVSLRAGKVVETRAYLSEEAELRRIGRIAGDDDDRAEATSR